jgi:tRNA(Arg) A34 adenosine deaminase TadA
MAVSVYPPNPIFMRRAIAEALAHLLELAGGPFGACLIRGAEVLAVAHNTVLKAGDPRLNTYDLSGCEIYSTTEPCPMCFAAIHWARLDRVVYGTALEDAVRLGFSEMIIGCQQMKIMGKSPVAIYPGFLLSECRELLDTWENIPGKQVY